MSDWRDLIDRTIVAVVEESNYGDSVGLRLDDGRVALVKGYSYEDVDIDVTLLDRAAWNARVRERVGEQHRRWLQRLQREARQLEEQRLREFMQGRLSPERYEEWLAQRQMTLGRMGGLISEVWAKEIAAAIWDTSTLLNAQVFDRPRGSVAFRR